MISAGTAGGPATAAAAVERTADERRAALDVIAAEVRSCTKCRLAETRTNAVPGEGRADTEVVFVGEGPGQTEDQQGRPFVGRAGDLLVKLLSTLGWRRQEVFITNIVKCRPPGNRDPEPDEIAACAPYLQRQLEILDPAVVATLGRFSMGYFRPGERITQIHGTTAAVAPQTRARDAVSLALFRRNPEEGAPGEVPALRAASQHLPQQRVAAAEVHQQPAAHPPRSQVRLHRFLVIPIRHDDLSRF